MRFWMMIGLIIGVSAAVWAASTADGQEWALVNNAVKSHRVSAGISIMAHSVKSDPSNPELLYDLGTGYLMVGKVGPAVWNLEKARELMPRDRAIRANLKAAHQRVHAVPSATPIWDAVVDLMRWVTAKEAAWGWIGLTTILSALGLGWGIRRVPLSSLRIGVVVWSVLTIPVAVRMWDAMSPRGVVIVPTFKLKISPDVAAPSVTHVPAGTVVRLPDFRAGWGQIQLPDGIMGWGAVDDVRPL